MIVNNGYFLFIILHLIKAVFGKEIVLTSYYYTLEGSEEIDTWVIRPMRTQVLLDKEQFLGIIKNSCENVQSVD